MGPNFLSFEKKYQPANLKTNAKIRIDKRSLMVKLEGSKELEKK